MKIHEFTTISKKENKTAHIITVEAASVPDNTYIWKLIFFQKEDKSIYPVFPYELQFR